MTAVGRNVKDPARLAAVAARPPDNTRGRQDGAHSGALDTRDVGAQLVAYPSRPLEQPPGGQAFHQRSERVRNR